MSGKHVSSHENNPGLFLQSLLGIALEFVLNRHMSSSLPSAQCLIPSQYFSIGMQFPSLRHRNSFDEQEARFVGQFSSSSPNNNVK